MSEALDGALKTEEPLRLDHRVVRPGGEVRSVYLRGEMAWDGVSKSPRLLGTLLDVTERKELERQLEHQAYHDLLTGLPNRALFANRLETAVHRARRQDRPVAVLFLDLDGFKGVNDELGHEAGDALLREVASRLRTCLRPYDTLARLGGDEFVMLLHDVDEAYAAGVAERVIGTVSEQCVMGGGRIRVGASVGIALSQRDLDNPDRLLRMADMAMYRAKRGGKGRYEFYDGERESRTGGRDYLETGR